MRKDQTRRKRTPPSEPPLWVGCFLTSKYQLAGALDRDFVQANLLDRSPDDAQAAHFGGEHVDLVGALPNVAE